MVFTDGPVAAIVSILGERESTCFGGTKLERHAFVRKNGPARYAPWAAGNAHEPGYEVHSVVLGQVDQHCGPNRTGCRSPCQWPPCTRPYCSPSPSGQPLR